MIMKKLMLIIMCLVALNSDGQYYDSKEQYLKERNSPDSLHARWKWKQDSINAPWNNRVHEMVKKQNAEEDRRHALLMKNPDYKRDYNRAKKGEIWIGMRDDLCIEALTTPNSRKTTYTKGGKTEVWIYQGQADGCIGDCPYLDYIITFKNHKIIAITTGD